MIKETKYNGYSAVPSDYECADGDLAAAVNLIPEDGALRPVLAPKVLFTLKETQEVIFIHTTAYYTNYIVRDTSGNQLLWMDSTGTNPTNIASDVEVADINAICNTLLVFSETCITYYLWQSGTYKKLGSHLPELVISFGLMGHPRLWSISTADGETKKRGTFNITFDKIAEGKIYDTFTDDNKTKITSQVMAKVNKFIAEQTTNKGRFCFPFFVRWAYRLFDGTHTMHSAPVLMCPSTTAAPIVFCKDSVTVKKGGVTSCDLDIMLVAADLNYAIPKQPAFDELDDWKDIISGIDIYISKPIYTYDQSGECSSFGDEDNFDCKFIGRLYNGEKDKDEPDSNFAYYDNEGYTEDRMMWPFNITPPATDFRNKYMEYKYAHIYEFYFDVERNVPSVSLHMPEFSDEKRDESIEATANFYKLASLELKDLAQDKRKTITVDDEYLQSLVNREAMTDDYQTHDTLMASQSSVYNARLNLTGVRRALFDGFKTNAMFAYCDDAYAVSTELYMSYSKMRTVTVTLASDSANYKLPTAQMSVVVYIRENNEVYAVRSDAAGSGTVAGMPALRRFMLAVDIKNTVRSSDGTYFTKAWDYNAGTLTTTYYDSDDKQTSQKVEYGSFYPYAWGSWLYYPNANAFHIAIYSNVPESDGSNLLYHCDLKAHDYLNGAYAFLGFNSQRGNGSSVTALPTTTQSSTTVPAASKIYTSEANNPFYFPVTGINTVGTGTILGICTAAKALSQGQFGQFPLYAFSTEGVWALEVSSTGSYSAKQPITRDVCTNAKSITQMDSSVLFVTDRGIMQISGSNTACLSEGIDTEYPFDFADLPSADTLLTLYNKVVTVASDQLAMGKMKLLPFRTFLKDCRIVYDYTHQRIVVYNPSCHYAYVYSIQSSAWGMMHTNITSDVNSYPDALAMDADHRFINLSASDAKSARVLAVTRPFKFGDPDLHKTIDTIIQRGMLRKGHIAQVLYGSNDLRNWHTVWSSVDERLRGFRGSPYKYFRIAFLGTLEADENIYGFTTQYTPRLTNQPR